MNLRCKEGDLALVIHDEPGCEANIGRVVEVRGPLNVNLRLALPCWLIQPAKPGPWAVTEFDGAIVSKVVGWESLIEHPDAWLQPLRPLKGEPREDARERAPETTIVG